MMITTRRRATLFPLPISSKMLSTLEPITKVHFQAEPVNSHQIADSKLPIQSIVPKSLRAQRNLGSNSGIVEMDVFRIGGPASTSIILERRTKRFESLQFCASYSWQSFRKFFAQILDWLWCRPRPGCGA